MYEYLQSTVAQYQSMFSLLEIIIISGVGSMGALCADAPLKLLKWWGAYSWLLLMVGCYLDLELILEHPFIKTSFYAIDYRRKGFNC